MWPAVVIPGWLVPDPVNPLRLVFFSTLYFVANHVIQSTYYGVQDHIADLRIVQMINCGCWDIYNFYVDIMLSIIL